MLFYKIRLEAAAFLFFLERAGQNAKCNTFDDDHVELSGCFRHWAVDIISHPRHGFKTSDLARHRHALMKEEYPGVTAMVRVQNKRREFLWVHPQFADEY